MSEPSPRATAAWLDRATLLLLLGAVFIVVFAGMPLLGHELGLRPAHIAPAPVALGPGPSVRERTIRVDELGASESHDELLGFGRVVRDTPLSSHPGPGARLNGSLMEGEHVLLVRKQGSWVEVVRRSHEQGENVGWVPAVTIDVL